MHLGGPLPSVGSRPIARQSWPRDGAALPGRPASPPIRVTVVAAELVAPVLLLPGPCFSPESL